MREISDVVLSFQDDFKSDFRKIMESRELIVVGQGQRAYVSDFLYPFIMKALDNEKLADSQIGLYFAGVLDFNIASGVYTPESIWRRFSEKEQPPLNELQTEFVEHIYNAETTLLGKSNLLPYNKEFARTKMMSNVARRHYTLMAVHPYGGEFGLTGVAAKAAENFDMYVFCLRDLSMLFAGKGKRLM